MSMYRSGPVEVEASRYALQNSSTIPKYVSVSAGTGKTLV